MKKRITGIILGAVLCAGLLAGCGSVSETETEELQTIKVGMLGKDIKTACIILAEEKGYFDEERVDVSFEQVSSLPEGITAVSQGNLDILPYGAIPSCSFISQGTDLVIFGGTISEGSECITLPENADKYSDANSFKGAKIGCFRMESGHMIMKGWLREQGLDINEDVEIIYLDSQASIMEAVSKGEVDMGFVNSGYGYICKQSGLSVAFQVGDYVDDFLCCRQTTSREALENKNEELVRFEIAALRGYTLYKKEPDEAVALLAEYSGQEEDYVKAIMYGSGDYENAMVISLDPNSKKILDFYEVMKANGDIDAETPYDIASYIDTDIYKTALETLISRGDDKELYEGLMEDFEANN